MVNLGAVNKFPLTIFCKFKVEMVNFLLINDSQKKSLRFPSNEQNQPKGFAFSESYSNKFYSFTKKCYFNCFLS